MGMEFWLIPLIAILVAGIGVFYLVIRRTGGSCERRDGNAMVDKPPGDEPPRSEWNYYRK